MDEQKLQNLRDRTDAKLRYAKIHLDELMNLRSSGGSDFDRAHQESFLYHLIGAKDAFLVELNEFYKAGLKDEQIAAGNLSKSLSQRGIKSSELAELVEMENSKDSWLYDAKSIRNHSTHIYNVPRHFHVGGSRDYVLISNPKNGKVIETELLPLFSEWLNKMRNLLLRLRESALFNSKG